MATSPEGRWGGRTTRRALPDDPAIEALAPAEREELATHWLARAASERRVGDAFAYVHRTLEECGAPAPLASLALRAVDDELRHAELAREVASRFAGRELAPPAPLPLSIPNHPGASASMVRTLHILGQCALNETFASAVLEAALAASTGTLARAAIRELLADEIDHARVGWGYLASLPPSVRTSLGPWLPALVRENLRAWRTTDRALPSNPRLVAHGALSEELLEGALDTALRTLLVPGFSHLGVPTDALVASLESRR